MIESAKSEIDLVAGIIATRSPNIVLEDCNGDICFLDNFQISQDGAHLDCQGKTIKPENNADIALVVTANNASVVNCRIDSFRRNAIEIRGSGNIIANNIVVGNPEGGLVIDGDDNKIFNNDMKDNKKFNVHIQEGRRNNIIYNNTMLDTPGLYQPYTHAIGAISVSGSDNIVLGNTIRDHAEIGIKMETYPPADSSPSGNLVAGNTVENSGVLGLEITGAVVGELGSAGPPDSPVSNGQNIVFNNTFSQSKNEFGLRIRWSNNNRIIENSINGNNWQGIHIMVANGTLIERNIIFENKEGGIWLGNSNNNEIYSNEIYDNGQHCGILFTKWMTAVSVNNTAKNNVLTGNGGMHDDKQICDEDGNSVSQNEFH